MALAIAAAPQVSGVPGDHKRLLLKLTTAGSDYPTNGWTLIPSAAGNVSSGNTLVVPSLVRSINFGWGNHTLGYLVSIIPVSDTDPAQGVTVKMYQQSAATGALTEVTNAGGTAGAIYLYLMGK